MANLSVIVPATDRPAGLPRCLAALDRSREPAGEIIVVERPEDAGPALARNEGASRAGGDVLVFVDADVEVHPDALGLIDERLVQDPALTAVFGSYDDAPDAPGVVSQFRNLLHHHVHQSSPGPARTFWTGLGAVRRDAFFAVGGFDAERYPRATIEDIDLGIRLADRGARIELDPRIQGTHLKSWTLSSMLETDFARRGVPWVALMARRGEAPTALNLGWSHRGSSALAVAGTVALCRGRPLVAAACLGGLVALNRPFYSLLERRLGIQGAAAGVALHALHHVTGAAAVPAGLLTHLVESGRAGEPEG